MIQFGWIENLIEDKLLNLHTAFLGRVVSVNGDAARVQPRMTYGAAGGVRTEHKAVSVMIPKNVKYKAETITYFTGSNTTNTKEVLTPDSVLVGDIVFCGVCERDITNARNGIETLASSRRHNVNDGVILRVL